MCDDSIFVRDVLLCLGRKGAYIYHLYSNPNLFKVFFSLAFEKMDRPKDSIPFLTSVLGELVSPISSRPRSLSFFATESALLSIIIAQH